MKENKKTTVENQPEIREEHFQEPTFLVIHGAKYITQLTKKYENRKKWIKPNEKHILSFIPGTVNNILVTKGQKIKKGEKLIVLEAMKMLTEIISPIDGTIKYIHIAEGDRIPKGTLMVEFV